MITKMMTNIHANISATMEAKSLMNARMTTIALEMTIASQMVACVSPETAVSVVVIHTMIVAWVKLVRITDATEWTVTVTMIVIAIYWNVPLVNAQEEIAIMMTIAQMLLPFVWRDNASRRLDTVRITPTTPRDIQAIQAIPIHLTPAIPATPIPVTRATRATPIPVNPPAIIPATPAIIPATPATPTPATPATPLQVTRITPSWVEMKSTLKHLYFLWLHHTRSK